MENMDKKLDQLLGNIHRQIPELNDAGLLTDAIMNKITIKKRNKKPVLLIWIRTLSTTAAAFLIMLYFYQYSNNQATSTTTTPVRNTERSFNLKSDCFKMDHNTRKINFVKSYLCYQKQNSLKKKQLHIYCQQFNIRKNENNN